MNPVAVVDGEDGKGQQRDEEDSGQHEDRKISFFSEIRCMK